MGSRPDRLAARCGTSVGVSERPYSLLIEDRHSSGRNRLQGLQDGRLRRGRGRRSPRMIMSGSVAANIRSSASSRNRDVSPDQEAESCSEAARARTNPVTPRSWSYTFPHIEAMSWLSALRTP
jgi:hypothetical protein